MIATPRFYKTMAPGPCTITRRNADGTTSTETVQPPTVEESGKPIRARRGPSVKLKGHNDRGAASQAYDEVPW